MTSALDLLMDSDSTAETTTLLESNGICTIDSKTRTIFVPSEIVVGAVQSDKNAERIKFSCPKIVGDNLDLSKFSIRINFENVSSVDPDISIKDQYICEDASVNEDNIIFSWVIGKNAARYMGTIRFIVCAVKTDSDSNISIEWNTTVAQIPVLEAHMENQSVPDAYAIPETTTREYNSDITNTDKDFILSNKEKKTLSKNDKGSKTSAPNNINILNINNIPSRTTEQKEVYRKQKQKNRSEKYRDEDVPQILYNEFDSLYGEQENILEDHDICLTMAVIAYYFKQYCKHMGEQHTMISAEYADQFMGVIIGDDSPLLKADVEEKDELRFYQDMIDEFFKSDLGQRNGKSFDRHIWLFFTEENQRILCERVKQKWEEEVECQ